MRGKVRTHDEFVEDVTKIFPNITIISEFKGVCKQILAENEFGVCRIYASSLLEGCEITIKSAINKTEYFKKKSFVVHKDRYDYSKVNYTLTGNKVIIICKKHGDFLVTPQNHLAGSNCPTCGREHTTEIAKQQTTSWKYSDWEKQGNSSKAFVCFKLYIIKMFNENECFYKIGKTFNAINIRYRKSKLPYKIEPIYELCESAKTVSKLEQHLKRINKHNKYLPLLKFGGMHECFSEIENLDNIENYIQKLKSIKCTH
jgi:hypothetical protein